MVDAPLIIKKVSELDAAAALSGTDKVPIMQGANTVQTNLADVKTFVSAGAGGGGLAYGGQNSRYFAGFGYRWPAAGTFTIVANQLYARPFSISESISFTKIGINVQVLSAGNARLGIYTWVDGLPAALVLDAGTVSTGSTGDKEIAITQTLTAGAYGLAIICNATPTLRGLQTEPAITCNYFGWNDTSASAGNPSDVYESRAYGALPATFGTAVYEYAAGQQVPGVWLRK